MRPRLFGKRGAADGLGASVLEAALDAIVVVDADGRIIEFNPAAERAFGHARDDALGRDAAELLLPPRLRAEGRSHFRPDGAARRRVELIAMRAGGREFPVELTSAPTDVDGRPALTAFMRDISDRRRNDAREAAVAELGRRGLEGLEVGDLMREATEAIVGALGVALAVALEAGHDGELQVRGWSGLPLGSAAAAAGASSSSPEREEALRTRAPVVVADWRREQRFEAPSFLRDLGVRSAATVPIEGRSDVFGTLSVYATEPNRFGADDVHFLQAISNVLAAAIERARAEEETVHRSLHDALTGLPNRALLLDRIGNAVARARRRHLTPTVFFLDLDNFKLINDSLGHQAGDELLMGVAPRLRAAVRPDDTVARFGGDEFVVLCEDVPSREDAEAIAQRILSSFDEPFTVAGKELVIKPSVGVAIAEGPDQDPAELIRDADAAMYRAKELGRGRYEIFDAELRDRVSGRLKIEASLRGVAERGELRAFYQPLVELTGGIVGAEALLRWEHPAWGWLRPGEFIPIAEESDLILPVGEWILREACRQAADWGNGRPGAGPLSLSVNLSARQLSDPELPRLVERVVSDTGVDPARIALEITETALMADGDVPIRRLQELKDLGLQIVLDDFGTGYSSLTYLSRLPIDMLKLDRSFVARLGTEDGQATAAIISAVVGMSQALGLSVVAEGVETAEQVERLADLGCEVAQGFHFARPMAAPAFSELLLKGRALAADSSEGDADRDAPLHVPRSHVGWVVPPRRARLRRIEP